MNVDSRPINILSLFSGAGGLDHGIRLAIPRARTVCFVEHDAFACEALVRAMEAARVAPAPVWTDIRTFDGRPWREVVDLIAGGFPCTDISVAGKREGITGEHSGLWGEFRRVIEEAQPLAVFIENTAGLGSASGDVCDLDGPGVDNDADGSVRALGAVLGDLAALGFDAEWGVLRASDVGATHQRARIFILAHARRGRGDWLQSIALAGSGGEASAGRGSARLADSPVNRRKQGRAQSGGQEGRLDAAERGKSVDHAQGERHGPGRLSLGAESTDTLPAVAGDSVADSTGSRSGDPKDAGTDRGDEGPESAPAAGREEPERARDAVADAECRRREGGRLESAAQTTSVAAEDDGAVGHPDYAGREEQHSPPPRSRIATATAFRSRP